MAGIRQIGDWIDGRYEVHDVHNGGMGVVYVTYDHQASLGRRVVALKTLRDEFLEDDRLIGRFAAECETWVRVDRHLHVVRAYSVQEIEDRPFVLMELVTGGTLRQWIGTPRLDLRQVLRFGIQFCLGFEHALRKGLRCHRDIKPENLLITEGGTLKITDFGLAKILDLASAPGDRFEPIPLVEITDVEAIPDEELAEDGPESLLEVEALELLEELPRTEVEPGLVVGDPVGPTIAWPPVASGATLSPRPGAELELAPTELMIPTRPATTNLARITQAGQWVGTPYYSSPEQFRESSSVDWRTDMYAFGVVLFEMIAGRRPFQGTTLGAIKRQHIHVSPPSIVPWVPDKHRKIADALDGIVRRCLAKSPDRRYRSFADLRDALSRCLWQIAREVVHSPAEAELDAWEFTGKGVALGTLGHFDEELQCYDRALRSNSNFVPAWFNKAAALGDLGRWEEATEAADAALARNPRSEPAHLNLGLVLHALGRGDEALAHLEAAVSLCPHDPDAWQRRALVLQDRGDDSGFRADMLRALRLRPTFVEALYALSPETSAPPRRSARLGASAAGEGPAGPSGPDPIRLVRRHEDTPDNPSEGSGRGWISLW